MLWRSHSCFTESKAACLFDGHLSEMSEEEFWLTVKRTEKLFLPFDVVYIAWRRAAGGSFAIQLSFSFPEAVGDFIFLSPLLSAWMYTYQHSDKNYRDMHTTCQSYNLPVRSNNYKVFQRNTWIKKLVYHPMLSLAAGFKIQHCHSFCYFITCIHFSLFQMWYVSVGCLHCSFYWKSNTLLLTVISVSAIAFMLSFFASLFPLKNSLPLLVNYSSSSYTELEIILLNKCFFYIYPIDIGENILHHLA